MVREQAKAELRLTWLDLKKFADSFWPEFQQEQDGRRF